MRRIAITGVALCALLAPAVSTVSAVPAMAVDNPILTTGMTNPAVVRVQKALGVTPASGYFGPLTLQAVKTYQRQHAIPATGVVGPLTWASLTSKTVAAKQPKKAAKKHATKHKKKHHKKTKKKTASVTTNPYAAATLQYGDKGAAVLYLQKALDVQPQTGFFGPITESFVKALQTAAKLPVSGIVDAATWKKVGKVSFTKPAPVTTPTVGTTTLPAPSNATAAEVLRIAASQAGVPYVATGNSPSTGFNCSSYTQWVFEQVGMNLGGAYTVWQYNNSRHISAEQAKPGDLVFFHNFANDFIGHVGIYAGNGMMWHAPRTGRVVSLEKVYTDQVYYGRVLNQ